MLTFIICFLAAGCGPSVVFTKIRRIGVEISRQRRGRRITECVASLVALLDSCGSVQQQLPSQCH